MDLDKLNKLYEHFRENLDKELSEELGTLNDCSIDKEKVKGVIEEINTRLDHMTINERFDFWTKVNDDLKEELKQKEKYHGFILNCDDDDYDFIKYVLHNRGVDYEEVEL